MKGLERHSSHYSNPAVDQQGPRPLYRIARDIKADWKNVYFGAAPYLEALGTLRSIDDQFGEDSGRSIVAYFLANAQGWRGAVAKRVKLELKDALKAKVIHPVNIGSDTENDRLFNGTFAPPKGD